MELTIESQTGWNRPFPKVLLQDIELLEKVTDYSFDLNNPDFVKYFIARTGTNILDPDVKLHLVMASEEIHCKIVRGKMQDCWEIFNTGEDEKFIY